MNICHLQADPTDDPGRFLHLAEEPGDQGGEADPEGTRFLRPRQASAQGISPPM